MANYSPAYLPHLPTTVRPRPSTAPYTRGMAAPFKEAAQVLRNVRSSEAEVEDSLSNLCLALFR